MASVMVYCLRKKLGNVAVQVNVIWLPGTVCGWHICCMFSYVYLILLFYFSQK